VKGVGAGKLNLARGRRDCVETDRALHFCMLSGGAIVSLRFYFNFIQHETETS
jgi:hypothetical protein